MTVPKKSGHHRPRSVSSRGAAAGARWARSAVFTHPASSLLVVLDGLFDQHCWNFHDVYRALSVYSLADAPRTAVSPSGGLEAFNWWQELSENSFPAGEEDAESFVRAFVIGAASDLR